jgi:hypothetical protein
MSESLDRIARARSETREILSASRLADLDEALASLTAMSEEGDEGYTWMDQDPLVAWEDEGSHHGRSREAMILAGWEGCHHRSRGSGSQLHLNIKLSGSGRWRGYQDYAQELESKRGDTFNRELFDEIANQNQEWEIESGWEDARYRMADLLGIAGLGRSIPSLYSGGNGGWMEIPRELESDPESACYFAVWILEQIESLNSWESGRWIGESAIEQYDEIRLADIASPRSEAMSDLGLSWMGGRR